MYIIAIDLGTQSVRAALVTPGGEIARIEQRPHGMESPWDGWAQQRPSQWWDLACQCTGSIMRNSGIAPGELKGVSVCGQMHGAVGIDGKGAVVTEWAQLWCDKRCREQCESLRAGVAEAKIAESTGNYPIPGWTGFKVRWLKDHDPEAYNRSEWFLVPKDFINFRLTGIAATDKSEASGTFLWDCREERYSPGLAELLGVDLRRFAPVRDSTEIIGAVTEAAARETEIPPGTPVVAGGGDFIVSLLGLGLLDESTAVDISGTSTLLVVKRNRPVIDPSIQNLRHALEGWVPFVMLDCGGLAMKWMKDFFDPAVAGGVSYEALIGMAEAVPPGADGLTFLPYPLGERRRDNAGARGAFLGMTLNHGAGHFARAVMEGVACFIGMNVNAFRSAGIDIRRVISLGGATRNRLWNRIKADLLQLPVAVSREPEATLRGAGLLGALATGLIRDLPPPVVDEADLVRPEPRRAKEYRRALGEFQRAYGHMRGYWK